MDEPLPNPLLQELISLVGGLAHRMQAHLDAVSKEFGLSLIEARALFLLDPRRAMSGLAGDLCCDASYITMVADHLEKEGLIERHIDPHDRRFKRLIITPKGLQVRQQMQVRAEHDLPVAAGLSTAQQQTLRDLLAILAAHASQASSEQLLRARAMEETSVGPDRIEQTSEGEEETKGGDGR